MHREGGGRECLVADHDLGLIVENAFWRQLLVADGHGETRAVADGEAEIRVDAFAARATRAFSNQHALADLLVRSGLRQSAPIAVWEMHSLAGHRLFRCG